MNEISQRILVFHDRIAPVEGYLVGYGAIIDHYKIKMPIPTNLAIISSKKRVNTKEGWLIFEPKYKPTDTLASHLIFALKYEGLNLLLFKKLFEKILIDEITGMIQAECTGKYMRKIWFLYEWLMQTKLPISDLKIKNYELLIDEKLQYADAKSINSSRHRIKNNLPGTVN